MGVETVESKLPVEGGSEGNMAVEAGQGKERGKGNVNIKFGSHGAEDKISDSNLPKDAVDEWPEPAKVHSFYIFRYRVFEDRNLRAKQDAAEKELQKKNQARLQIFEKLKAKRAARSQIRSQIHSLSVENKQFRSAMDEKRKEMEPLQQALGKLRGGGPRGSAICSSEEELNDVIKSLQYRIQHESIPLSEEKQILREIKQLEGTREKVIANAAERAKIQESLGEKNVIQDQVKSIGVDLDGVRKEKQAIFSKIKQLDEAKLAFEKDIKALEDELKAITQKRDLILDSVNEMRRQREQDNTPFYLNRTLLAKAKVLAAKKDVEAVKELSLSEVEKFMSLWNSKKDFRDDYLSRILQSLDIRQLSKDGRIRNPGEKPLLQVERTPVPSETPVLKTNTKQPPKEDSSTQKQTNASSEPKAAKSKNAKNNKEANKKTEIEKIDQEYNLEFVSTEKPQKDSVSKKPEVDEKKLKEMKRQEEIAKRQQAEERKKKLAEKAAAKAAIKAQKEAEKKLKAREKKAKKKSGAAAGAVDSEEATENVSDVAEPENVEETIETPRPQKNKEKLRHRASSRPKAPNSLPKAILKRKKATNYWVYYAVSAALALVLLMIAGYNYMLFQPTYENAE